jgi:HEAT repeat protein
MLITLQDKNFWLFLSCFALVTLALTPMFSFLPLFMKQEVGLSEGNVVLLQNGTLIGSLLATLVVGWSSDRYGGKPVLLSGITVMLILPIIWLFIPKHSSLSLPVALAAAVLQGGAHLTWMIGFGRLLYVNVIPSEHKAPYMAVYYATIGVVAGTSQLLGGIILDLTKDFYGDFLSFSYNPFTPIFVSGFLLLIISIVLFQSVRSDTDVGGRQFIGMFLRGNTRLAFGSMIGYYRAKDERETVVMTEKLGQAHSPLTADELLEALIDPRFNVRFEAIVSIARTNPDPRFVEALESIVHGTELALSSVAAWALGRIGDNHARDALRQGLDSEYRSIRAQCARALGTLGDKSIAPLLLERLKTEDDKGLQIGYSSALGRLTTRDATETILKHLDNMENLGARMELALSLARIIDEEHSFIRILRQIRNDPGTIAAQILEAARHKLENNELSFSECIDLWAHEDLNAGSIALASIIRQLPEDTFDDVQQQIMKRCAQYLENGHDKSLEYLILALYIIEHV